MLIKKTVTFLKKKFEHNYGYDIKHGKLIIYLFTID